MAEPSRAGFFAAFRKLLATLVASGRTRLELLTVELEEEKLRLVDLFVSAFAALFVFSLGIVLTIVCLAVAFWEQRLAVFGGAAGFMLLAGVLLVWRIRCLISKPSKLFRSSMAELDKDLAALRGEVPAERT